MLPFDAHHPYHEDTFYLLYPLKKSIDTLLQDPQDTLFTREYPSVALMLAHLEKCFTMNLKSDVNLDSIWTSLEDTLKTTELFKPYKYDDIYQNDTTIGKLRGLFSFLLNEHLFEDFLQKLFLYSVLTQYYVEHALWNNEEQRYLFMDMIKVLTTLNFSLNLTDPDYNSSTVLQSIQCLSSSSNRQIVYFSCYSLYLYRNQHHHPISSIFSSINNSLFYFDNYVNTILTSKQDSESFEQPLFDPQNHSVPYLQRVNNEPQTCVPSIITYALSWLIDNSTYQNKFFSNQDISSVLVLRKYYSQHHSFPDYTDAGSVWSLLITYFTHIPNSLFTNDKSYAFLSCQYIFNTKLRIKAICNLLRDLPLPHKYLMERFFYTLSQLYYSMCHSPEEYTYRKRVCEVFGTIILRHDNNLYFQGAEKEAAIDLVDFMLMNCNDIFLGIQKELEILEVLLTNKKKNLIHINQKLNENVDCNNINHILLLKRLWYSLVGRKLEIEGKDPVSFSPTSELWSSVGFQREEPWTDFRGGGVYSLENLVYFVENYPSIIDDVLSFDEAHFFPLAIVGVNVTNLIAHLLKLDVDPQEYSPMSHVHTPVWSLASSPGMFNKFYCMVMLLVITEYKLYQASILKINPILSAVKADLTTILDSNPYQLSTLAKSIENLRMKCIQSFIEEEDSSRNTSSIFSLPHLTFSSTKSSARSSKQSSSSLLNSKDDLQSKSNQSTDDTISGNLDLYKISSESTNSKLLLSLSRSSNKFSFDNSETFYEYIANPMQYGTGSLLNMNTNNSNSPNESSPHNHAFAELSTGQDKHRVLANVVNIDPTDSLVDLSYDNYTSSNMIIPEKYRNEIFILSPSYFKILEKHVPLRFQGNALKLIYKLQVDGASCTTLIEKSRGMNTGLLVIKDAGNGVFGGYITESLKYTQRYYGSGESFVFSFSSMVQAKIYPWSKLNSYFIHSDETHIGMGGGGSFAFYIDSDLNDGYSGDCKTYNSECLATTGDFQCYDIELWTFLNPIEMFNN